MIFKAYLDGFFERCGIEREIHPTLRVFQDASDRAEDLASRHDHGPRVRELWTGQAEADERHARIAKGETDSRRGSIGGDIACIGRGCEQRGLEGTTLAWP